MSLAERVAERVSLAQIYFEDGALFSAARCLREGADLCEQHARTKNDALGVPSTATDAPGAEA